MVRKRTRFRPPGRGVDEASGMLEMAVSFAGTMAVSAKVAFFAGSFRSYRGIAWSSGKPEAQGYYVFALPE